jgi:hypothetical protein
MRYENEGRVSLQMRTVKDAPNFIRLGANEYEARCVVVPKADGKTAQIILVKKKPADAIWTEVNTSAPTLPEDVSIVQTWTKKVLKGLAIQFNRQGKWFYLKDSFTIDDCNAPLPVDPKKVPDDQPALAADQYSAAVHFKVTQRPASMLNSITVLPRGTVVDFQHSGHEPSMSGGTGVTFGEYEESKATHVTKSVMVMFSPAGYVDRFYVDGTEDGKEDDSGRDRPFRGVFYFLVGEWDKIDRGEDNKNNLETGSNFWVTVKDRDGTVRTSPNNVNAAGTADQRKHAREDLYNNIGGL